jgi:hypothetical protein
VLHGFLYREHTYLLLDLFLQSFDCIDEVQQRFHQHRFCIEKNYLLNMFAIFRHSPFSSISCIRGMSPRINKSFIIINYDFGKAVSFLIHFEPLIFGLILMTLMQYDSFLNK